MLKSINLSRILIFHYGGCFYGKLNYAKEKIIIQEGAFREERGLFFQLVGFQGKQKDVAWIIYLRHLSRNENVRAQKPFPSFEHVFNWISSLSLYSVVT